MQALICISTDTPEELLEIEKILSESKRKYVIYRSEGKGKFSKAITLITFLRKNKINTIIGSPCLRNRIANFFGVKYISYIRSLHPSPELASSLSDKIYFLFKKIGIESKILNPYSADICFVTSKITEGFLGYRGIEKFNIKNIGACWLDELSTSDSENLNPSICFITQAFSKHLNEPAHREQIQALENSLDLAYRNEMELIIRKHPRDEYDYEKHFTEKAGCIKVNTETPRNFIKNFNPRTIIISSFSTLAFELLGSGASAIFISLGSVPSYDTSFSKIGIIPKNWRHVNLNDANQYNIEIFKKYNTTEIDLYLSNF